jgi:hypothetical protein
MWHQQILEGLFSPQPIIAVVCEDRFGKKYRFKVGSAVPDLWTPGTPEPSWATWYA